jgi:tetratricopeptide (TPR) repeat protein
MASFVDPQSKKTVFKHAPTPVRTDSYSSQHGRPSRCLRSQVTNANVDRFRRHHFLTQRGADLSTSLRTSAATFLLVFGVSTGVLLAQNLRTNDLPVSPNHIETSRGESAPQSMPDVQLTSVEIEGSRINNVYQQVVRIHLQGDYEAAAEKYRSVVIPMAENAQSDAIRGKFLFLSYRGLGNCYLAMSRFVEAEETFERLFEYLPASAGRENSDYAINFESIAMARMGQQRWKSAEESLQKAVSIFDDQIGRAATSTPDSVQNEHANKLRVSEDMALNLVAVVYFREQRYTEALEMLERAYNQGVTFGAPADIVEQIANDGRAVSTASGDLAAIALWSKRVASPN